MNIHHMCITSTAIRGTFQNTEVYVGMFKGCSAVPFLSLAE